MVTILFLSFILTNGSCVAVRCAIEVTAFPGFIDALFAPYHPCLAQCGLATHER